MENEREYQKCCAREEVYNLEETMRQHDTHKVVSYAIVAVGGLFGLWALAAMVGGLHRVDWQVTELIRHYLVASGMIKPIHTVVDFYSHIKGIEYLICVAFFVAFPIFFSYVEKSETRTPSSVAANRKKATH